jgi:lipopolysaccharide/colanic/teichoic acid biosynthesis glycosyltransferase
MSVSAAGDVAVPASKAEPVAALGATELGLLPAPDLADAGSSIRELLSGAAIRIVDVVVATFVLLVLLPLMVLTAIAVRLDSRGPVFFRSQRVGYRGRQLRMLKFRKMHACARGVPLTIDKDSRLTRVGCLLVRLRIDEIPQLWHVLRGTMSLVGPRPESPAFVALHPRDYAEILSVRPGITGLSQIAFVDERLILDPVAPVEHYVSRILPQKVALDRLYADRRSLALNLRILSWTAVAVLLRCEVAVHRETGKMNLRKR